MVANVDFSETPTLFDTDSDRNSTPSIQEAVAKVKGRRKSDPAWGYCTQITEGGKTKIKCMFCNMLIAGGGIHRFKQHLAKYPGNVAACKKVDPEVEHTMFQNIEDWNEKKNKTQLEYEEGNPYGLEPGEQDVVVEVSVANAPAAPSQRVAAAPAANKGKKRQAAKVGGEDEKEGEQEGSRGRRQRRRRGGVAGDSAVGMVKWDLLVRCLTCPLCDRLLRKATTISECLHTFCRKCVYKKLNDEDLDHCPVCNIDLGYTPVKKLRADHNIQDVRSKVFPFKRKNVNAEEDESPITLPVKVKKRSISSLVVNTPRVTPAASTRRLTRVVTRKAASKTKPPTSAQSPALKGDKPRESPSSEHSSRTEGREPLPKSKAKDDKSEDPEPIVLLRKRGWPGGKRKNPLTETNATFTAAAIEARKALSPIWFPSIASFDQDGSIPASSIQRDSTLPTTPFPLGIDLQIASTDSLETDHSEPIRIVESFRKMLPILEKDLVAMTEKAAQNDALKAKVDALQGHLDEITLEVQELEKEKKSLELLKEKMASTEAEDNNMKTECEALQSQVKEIPVLGSKIGSLKQDKKALQIENGTWKTQRQALQTQVEEIHGLRSQIKSRGELVTALRDEKARLEAELKAARSEREKYQIEVKSLRERIGTLEEKDVTWHRSEEHHKAAITAFEIQRDKMIQDKSAQDAEIKTLVADLEKVKSQVESYRSQLKAAKLAKEAVVQKMKTFKERAQCHLIDTVISCSGYLLALVLFAGPDCNLSFIDRALHRPDPNVEALTKTDMDMLGRFIERLNPQFPQELLDLVASDEECCGG